MNPDGHLRETHSLFIRAAPAWSLAGSLIHGICIRENVIQQCGPPSSLKSDTELGALVPLILRPDTTARCDTRAVPIRLPRLILSTRPIRHPPRSDHLARGQQGMLRPMRNMSRTFLATSRTFILVMEFTMRITQCS